VNPGDSIQSVSTEGDSERWQDRMVENPHHILAILPVARAMGAIVTTRLHGGVTHVVCDLKETRESLLCFRSATVHDFKDPDRGEKLLNYLVSNLVDNDVKLVRPGWVRSNWTKTMKDF
jgi:hypothetical protein